MLVVTTRAASQNGGLATVGLGIVAPAGSGLSPGVYQLSIIVLFTLDPSPPPAASLRTSTKSAHGRTAADRALMAFGRFSSASLDPFYPVSSSLCVVVAFPRVHARAHAFVVPATHHWRRQLGLPRLRIFKPSSSLSELTTSPTPPPTTSPVHSLELQSPSPPLSAAMAAASARLD